MTDAESPIPERLEKYHPMAFFAGVLAVPLLLLLRETLHTRPDFHLLFDEVGLAVKIVLVAAGGGFYFAQAVQKNWSEFVLFYLGASLSLLITLLLHVWQDRLSLLLAITFLFSLAFNLSKMPSSQEKFSNSLRLFTDAGSRVGFVFVSLFQYLISILNWIAKPLSKYTEMQLFAIGGVSFLAFLLALWASAQVQKSGPNN